MNPVRVGLYYVYVLQSKKTGDFYTGYTSDLRKRLSEHSEGRSSYTKSRGPYELVYFEACRDSNDAAMRERYLKSGMGKRYLKNRNKRFLTLTG